MRPTFIPLLPFYFGLILAFERKPNVTRNGIFVASEDQLTHKLKLRTSTIDLRSNARLVKPDSPVQTLAVLDRHGGLMNETLKRQPRLVVLPKDENLDPNERLCSLDYCLDKDYDKLKVSYYSQLLQK